QLQRAGDRRLGAGGDDGAGDDARPPLVAIVVDDVGELALAAPVHDVGGALALLFHAHVEGAVGAEGEAALGPVELHGGDADVEGDAVGGVDAARIQQRRHV